MKTAIVSLTKNGSITAKKIHIITGGDIYSKYPQTENEIHLTKPIKVLMEEIFLQYEAFVFIMATGIAVRTIAPLITKKDRDPAVVVCDERGRFSISLLSGHLGGANALAEEIAEGIRATAVITTATDINRKPAFDLSARKNDCVIEDLSKLAAISSRLVNGDDIKLYCPYADTQRIPQGITLTGKPQNADVIISNQILTHKGNALILRPQNLILGVGCRKGKPFEELKTAFHDFLKETKYAGSALRQMVSIDLKANEPGLLRLAEYLNIPFQTETAETLKNYTPADQGSAYVEAVTGTASVAEAAALCFSNGGSTLIPKTKYHGITFSLAECPTEIRLDL